MQCLKINNKYYFSNPLVTCTDSKACGDGGFCNFKDETTGFCEYCKDLKADNVKCKDEGFDTQKGTDECKTICEGMQSYPLHDVVDLYYISWLEWLPYWISIF